MITDAVLGVLQTALTWLAGLFPVPSTLVPMDFQAFFDKAGDLNYFLPISEVLTVTVSIMFVFPVLMGTTLAAWALAFIRGGNARG